MKTKTHRVTGIVELRAIPVYLVIGGSDHGAEGVKKTGRPGLTGLPVSYWALAPMVVV